MSHDVKNLDDIEFERLLREKEHKSLLMSLKKIVDVLESGDKSDSELKVVFDSLSQSIQSLPKEIQRLLEPMKSGDVSVNVNQDKVVEAVNAMGDKIISSLNEVKSCLEKEGKPKEFVFKIERHLQSDLIKQVTVTQK